MEAMIERAAEAGARKALREVGLSDEDANHDVTELRNLLDSFRSAKRTVGKTIVQALTTLFLAALMAVVRNTVTRHWADVMFPFHAGQVAHVEQVAPRRKDLKEFGSQGFDDSDVVAFDAPLG